MNVEQLALADTNVQRFTDGVTSSKSDCGSRKTG